MTRDEQITEALKRLNPPAEERAQCQAHVEELFDLMASAERAAEHVRITRKMLRDQRAALRRMRSASNAYLGAGGARGAVERALDFDEEWLTHWSPPSRWLKQQTAVELAYELLSCWNPDGIAVSRESAWHEMATILYGDRTADLFRQLRNFARQYALVKNSAGAYRKI
jgi:hypothetical protein